MNMQYVRTDEEIASQADYEAREAARHGRADPIVTIRYTIVRGKGEPGPVVHKIVWRLHRQLTHSTSSEIGDSTVFGPYHRLYEAEQAMNEYIDRDKTASVRLRTRLQIERVSR